MDCRLSVIIPNRNGEKTIGLCLEALFRSDHDSFEVIVVDDSSTDNSVSMIEKFPCTLVRLEAHCGTAAARNRGAQNSKGAVLFFTDADCMVMKDTLSIVEKAWAKQGPEAIIGGTYTCNPYDQNFFSMFQSVFIHFCELKNLSNPDYIAAHAMVISADTFGRSAGFPDDFLPIIEDVEFSHRLRRQGRKLIMEPELQVQHIFDFTSLADSMKNGFRKSKHWAFYSLGNKDLLADSGTASFELKINVLMFCLILILGTASFYIPLVVPPYGVFVPLLLNMFINRRLFRLLHKTGGLFFAIRAAMYYMLVYPLAVGTGALAGMIDFFVASSKKHLPQP